MMKMMNLNLQNHLNTQRIRYCTYIRIRYCTYIRIRYCTYIRIRYCTYIRIRYCTYIRIRYCTYIRIRYCTYIRIRYCTYIRIRYCTYYQGSFFFQLFNWFQLFSSEYLYLKIAGQSQSRSKMDHLKEGVDSFSYFPLNIFIWKLQDKVRAGQWTRSEQVKDRSFERGCR